jgi:hypothetical protein
MLSKRKLLSSIPELLKKGTHMENKHGNANQNSKLSLHPTCLAIIERQKVTVLMKMWIN